jgi:ClpP class serine protease
MSSNRIPTRVIAQLTDARWAMRPDQLEAMISIANRQDLDIRGLGAIAERMPQYKENADGDVLQVRNGNTAVIDIVGPCFRYANMMTEFCGATSYATAARQFRMAAEDRSIEAIVANGDTPGGEVNGCGEFAALIREISKIKPVIMYAGGDLCSAGYWLGSACSHIVSSTTSVIGCLGVVGIYTDRSKADEREGLRNYEIVSTLTPGKRPDISTDEGRSALLRTIDATAEVFLGDVARYRGIKGGAKAVAEMTQGGGMFVGQHAVDIGLADEIGTFEEVVASLSPSGA